MKSMKCGFEGRQMFHISIANPTYDLLRHTGSEDWGRPQHIFAGIEGGNKGGRAWNITEDSLLFGYTMLPHLQECGPVIESCGLYLGYVKTRMCRFSTLSDSDERFGAEGQSWTSVSNPRQSQWGKIKNAAILIILTSSLPLPSVWECVGRNWLD